MASAGLIPRHRLRWIPPAQRLAHEYCYFLHDECVRLLGEYEREEANLVSLDFTDQCQAAQFQRIAKEKSPLDALLEIGRPNEARRVILNSITMAMVSDCMHHIFESLRCMERRKFIVALNLFRKPLLDSLVFLSWMLGKEDEFYEAFTHQSPDALTRKRTGNQRPTILASALSNTELSNVISADWLGAALFEASNKNGLYWLLQRAVHLVTVERPELRTEPNNFNFIFKNHSDDDIYLGIYESLPGVLLYLSHVVVELFQRMRTMDPGARTAFWIRSVLGFQLLKEHDRIIDVTEHLQVLSNNVRCANCTTPLKLTHHNCARVTLTESFRCTACRKIMLFPFTWLF